MKEMNMKTYGCIKIFSRRSHLRKHEIKIHHDVTNNEGNVSKFQEENIFKSQGKQYIPNTRGPSWSLSYGSWIYTTCAYGH